MLFQCHPFSTELVCKESAKPNYICWRNGYPIYNLSTSDINIQENQEFWPLLLPCDLLGNTALATLAMPHYPWVKERVLVIFWGILQWTISSILFRRSNYSFQLQIMLYLVTMHGQNFMGASVHYSFLPKVIQLSVVIYILSLYLKCSTPFTNLRLPCKGDVKPC